MDVLSVPIGGVTLNEVEPEPKPCENELLADKEKILSSGIQLRTSARVLKKQKLDQEAHNSAEKKVEDKESNGIGSGSPVGPSRPVPTPKPQSQGQAKKRIFPTLWSPEEKSLFFEALNEMGRDFDGIEKYMHQKWKKGTVSSTSAPCKSKLQTKSFYNRMFLKISKYITLPDVVKKSTQEIYILINFGELRKRVGHITERNAIKLKELIFCGSTQVRVRGKTWRVKTPVCRALRKLNQLEDGSDEIRLPPKVDVYMRARTNRDAAVAESRGHNARLRASVPAELPLAALLGFAEARWGGMVSLGPPADTPLVQPTFRCGQLVTPACVSLLAHQARQGQPLPSLHSLIGLVPPVGVKAGRTWAKWHHEGEPPADALAGREVPPPPSVPVRESREDFERRIHSGWNRTNSHRIRIADLYIIFGMNGRLDIEYWWEGEQQDESSDLTSLRRLLSLARLWATRSSETNSQSSGIPTTTDKCWACRSIPPTPPMMPPPTAVVEVKTEPVETNGEGSDVIASNATAADSLIGRFRRPLLPAPRSRISEASPRHFQWLPKYCNRRGRTTGRSKGVVVKRMLPLLPKAPGSAPCTLVTLQVVAQGSSGVQAGTESVPAPVPAVSSVTGMSHLRTIIPKADAIAVREGNDDEKATKKEPCPTSPLILKGVFPAACPEQVTPSLVPATETTSKEKNPLTEENPAPTPSPLLGQMFASAPTDLQAANNPQSFSGLLGGPVGNDVTAAPASTPVVTDVANTPPMSPTAILCEGESQWLAGEVADFSLSSFLNHLDSPLKDSDTRISIDVDSHLQSMMMESSLDYTAKFADLAAKISGNANQQQQQPP